MYVEAYSQQNVVRIQVAWIDGNGPNKLKSVLSLPMGVFLYLKSWVSPLFLLFLSSLDEGIQACINAKSTTSTVLYYQVTTRKMPVKKANVFFMQKIKVGVKETNYD